jgi:hypothetical protein
MRSTAVSSYITLSLTALLMLGSAACAEQVGDIDRTQPDKVDKSYFEGEWFYLQTVVDVPYTEGQAIIGEQQDDPMDRIVWDIQEGFLYARRAREFVIGERDGELGAPLAAFAIDSHFDVIREYDSVTGEGTNVLVENDTDRPWYERRYMRVLWDTNFVEDYGAFFSGLISDDSVVPISDYQGDEALGDPGRTQVGRDYIETTQRLFVSPEMVCDDWNEDGVDEDEECESACWWYYTSDCVGGEVRFRHSFMKAEERDYVARHYDDHDMEKFGYFRTERFSYDRRRGITDPGRKYWQQRWNIWEGALTDTPCSDDSACGDAAGQVCDPVRGLCAKDYKDREVRPVTYYLSAGFPQTYLDSAFVLAAEWNRAFQTVVNEVKFNRQRKIACLPGDAHDGQDCCSTSDYAGGAAGCVPNVFILKENDCNEANVNVWARKHPELRDLMNDKLGGPPKELEHLKRVCAGFAQTTADETVASNRFVWQRAGDLRYSMLYWVDGPNYANPLGYGPSSADPTTGEIVQANAFVYGATIEEYAQTAVDVVRVINGELSEQDVVAGVDVRDYIQAQKSTDRARERRARLPADERARRTQRAAHPDGRVATGRPGAQRTARRGKTPNLSREELGRLREKIRGTAMEARLIPDHQKLMLGRTPAELSDPLTAIERGKMSPVSGMGRRRGERRRARVRRAIRKNMYLREFLDGSVLGYARSLKGVDEDTAHGIIANLVFTSTTEHEVGHTLGLRHNFAGSADPLNYFDKYWDLRGANPEPFTAGIDYTEEQHDGQMALYQYSSIMDYGARFQSDIKGLGSYDEAAIAYGYGGLVSRFLDLPARITGRFGEDGNMQSVLEDFHYTDYPDLFGGNTAALANREWVPAGTDSQREVPFKFCSDEYSGAWWDCDIWDRGADAYEIAAYAADSYRQYYIFDAYKRERYEFDPWDYSYRIYDRYFLVLMKLYQHWYFYDDGTEAWAVDPDEGQPLTLAANEALHLFWEILTTPDQGEFCYDPDDDMWYPDKFWGECAGTDESSLSIPLGEGRPSDVVFDYDAGYYFYEKILTAGSFYDKIAVMDVMSYPDTAFVGVDAASNADAITFTFFDAFPNLMIRLFGGMMAERPDWYAGRMVWSEDGGGYDYVPYDPLADDGGDELFTDEDSSPTYPEIDFNLQNWAAWDAMPYFAMGWDQRFNDAVRIYIKGSDEDSTPADPDREATFADPYSGRIYAAMRYDERFVSPAWQLVTDMQALADQWAAEEDPDDKDYVESLLRFKIDLADSYRSLYAMYGR